MFRAVSLRWKKTTKQQVRAIYLVYMVKGFTNLIDNECNIKHRDIANGNLETSSCWNITVHQITSNSSYFTNKLLYSRIKKTTCAPMREKPHTLGQLPSLTCGYCDQHTFKIVDLTCLNINVHLKYGWIYIYGHSSYNHVEVCSLTKNIKTWDKQTKACKTSPINQI